ncbi:MAG: hypothetical protein ACLVAK_07755 [Clostridia bacterium]
MSMTKEQKEVIKRLEKLVELRKNKAEQIKYDNCICVTEDLETVLNMLKEKDKENKILKVELEEKDMIINNAINAIEDLRQYFADNLQSDFILILEILKNSKVIDW